MSKQSENLHNEIAKVMDDLKCSFIEAILEVCQNNQIDPEDIVKQMDSITKTRAKQCAIENRMVRKAIIKDEYHPELILE